MGKPQGAVIDKFEYYTCTLVFYYITDMWSCHATFMWLVNPVYQTGVSIVLVKQVH